MDISVPTYIALIVGITGLMSIPIGTILRREIGCLEAFFRHPVKTAHLLPDRYPGAFPGDPFRCRSVGRRWDCWSTKVRF